MPVLFTTSHCFVPTRRCAPSSTRFPYTTLFRSRRALRGGGGHGRCRGRHLPRRGGVQRARLRSPGRQRSCDRPDHVGGARHRRSEEHTSELQSRGHLVCRLLLEKKKEKNDIQKY